MKWAIYLILLLVSFGAGWLATQHRLNGLAEDELRPRAVVPPEPVSTPAQVVLVERELNVESEQPELDEIEIGELSDAYIESLDMVPFDRSLALSQEVIDLLGLNATQVNEIHAQFAHLRSEIETLELDHLVVIDPGTDRMEMVIHPFEEEGKKLWEDTERTITEIVGPERSRILWHQGRDEIRERLRHFGAGEQRIEFTPKKGGGYQAMHRAGKMISVVFTGIDNEPIDALKHLFSEEHE